MLRRKSLTVVDTYCGHVRVRSVEVDVGSGTFPQGHHLLRPHTTVTQAVSMPVMNAWQVNSLLSLFALDYCLVNIILTSCRFLSFLKVDFHNTCLYYSKDVGPTWTILD